jgi:hypothetical protein
MIAMRGTYPFTPPFTVYARPDGQAAPSRYAPGAADERESGSAAILLKVIERLEDVIDQETAALRSRGKYDLKDFNDRKSHGLLELSRAIRLLNGGEPDETVKSRLAVLRGKLETNRAVLKMHLDAVREISGIVADAIRDAESDGTYSISIRNGQPQRRNAGDVLASSLPGSEQAQISASLLRNYDL